jgi:glycine/D-amino acid oxidase-like deaminating enzyme
VHITVLGAGITGITTAWYLRQAGHDVTVIDRREGPGLETSYANGGQISVSHAEPWANPQAPLQLLRWLGREDAPLLFRLRADWQQWRWGYAFLRECTPGRLRYNIRQLVAMGTYSRNALQQLRAETGIQYDQLSRGILHFYTSPAAWQAAQHAANLMREAGCTLDPKSADECVAIEPALASFSDRIIGGTYTPDDESGDAHRFTQELAELCAARGVIFHYGTSVQELLRKSHNTISAVRLRTANGTVESLTADGWVVCLGVHSAPLLRHQVLEIFHTIHDFPQRVVGAGIAAEDQAAFATVQPITHGRHRMYRRQRGNLASINFHNAADINFVVAHERLFRRRNHSEIRPDIPVEQVFFQYRYGRPCRVHRNRLGTQRADRIKKKCDRIDVIQMGVGNENMINQCQLGERQLADPGVGIDQNILIDQKRGGAVLLSADAAGTAEDTQTHCRSRLKSNQRGTGARVLVNDIWDYDRGFHGALSIMNGNLEFYSKPRSCRRTCPAWMGAA